MKKYGPPRRRILPAAEAMPVPEARPDAKMYLGYLDKEMTIMGVLSAFSVAALSAVLLKVVGADNANKGFGLVGTEAMWLVLVASLFTLGAALGFYRQRSLLAWHYGQIALAQSRSAKPESSVLEDLLDDADSWPTWIQYQSAFCLLAAGLVGYGLALVRVAAVVSCGGTAGSPEWCWLLTYGFLAAVGGAVMWRRASILRDDAYEDEPFKGRTFLGLGARPTRVAENSARGVGSK